MLWRVYRSRSKGRVGGGLVRIWQGEARDGPHAVAQAAQTYQGPLRGVMLFAEPADNDPYAQHAIIEES